jgi:hypothetical protein
MRVVGCAPYSIAKRSADSSGTENPVSFIPSGSKIRSRRISSSVLPSSTSSTRPSTSIAIE